MTETQETFVDLDGAIKGAVGLRHAGQDIAGRAKAAMDAIAGFHESKPWGNDDPGKEFHKSYLEVPADAAEGAEPAATGVLNGGKQMIDLVAQLGPDVLTAIDGTKELDEIVAKWFPDTGGQAK